LILAYVLYESIRCARPLAGVLVGAYGFFVFLAGVVAGDLMNLRYRASTSRLLMDSAFVVVGAVLGLVVSTVASLARRRPVRATTEASDVSTARPTGLVLIVAVALAATPLFESVLMTLQLDLNQSIQSLLDAGGDTAWWRLLAYDRPVVVLLSVLASYALLRRKRLARPAIVMYLAAGLALTVARLLVGVHLDSLTVVHCPADSGFVYANVGMSYAPVALTDYIRACGIEVAVRTAACAVAIPWLFMSGRLKEYLTGGAVQHHV